MLLVGGEVVDDRGERVGEWLGGELEGVEQTADACGPLGWRDSRLDPDPRGRPQPVGDRLTVEQAAVAAGRLQGVPERMSEVQCDPAPGGAALALVREDDLDLGPGG